MTNAPATRRSFLATLAAAFAGAALPARASGLRRRLGNIGVQLYTVRAAMQRDLAGTLERVAEIGYREVEFAGYFGHSPDRVRALVARVGLVAPSSHVAYELIGSDWPDAVRAARDAGHTYVTIPWVPEGVRRTHADWMRIAAQLSRAGEAARALGMRLAYHNQEYDLAPVNGTLPLEVLLAETEPGVVAFQLDVYWLVKAGGDPIAWLARFPGRFTMTHLKDSAGPPAHVMTDVGAGAIDFARLLDACHQAGVQHHFVEHDEPADPFASLQASYDHLAGLGRAAW